MHTFDIICVVIFVTTHQLKMKKLLNSNLQLPTHDLIFYYGTKFLFLLGCPFCLFRYNYEAVPNSWIHEGSDEASAQCFSASTSEINEMIHNTPPLSTKNFTTFANSSITFRVRRPLEKQLHHEEVLVIRSLKLENSRELY